MAWGRLGCGTEVIIPLTDLDSKGFPAATCPLLTMWTTEADCPAESDAVNSNLKFTIKASICETGLG